MPTRRWCWGFAAAGLGVGFVIGAIVGGVSTRSIYRPVAELFLQSPWVTATNGAGLDTGVLRKLRTGAMGDAAEMLESDLDGHLYALASYEESVPVDRRSQTTYNVLSRAASYRRDYPRAPRDNPDGPAVDATIAKALSLGQSHSGNASAP
jgi:hypothetical protein